MPGLEIIRAGETVPSGRRKVPLRVNSYVLCLDASVDWRTAFFLKGLCEFVLMNLEHLQQIVEERHLLKNEFALVISSATESLLNYDVIADRFSFIVCYPDLLLLDLPADSPLRKTIKKIKESGNQAAAVVANLLTVARGVASVREIADLNNLINEYLTSTEHIKIKTLNPSIVVKFESAPVPA